MPSSPTKSTRNGRMEAIMLGDVRRATATEKVVWSDPVSISDGSKQNNINIIIHSNDPQSLGRHGGDYLCLFWQRRYQQRLPCFCVGESGHNFFGPRGPRPAGASSLGSNFALFVTIFFYRGPRGNHYVWDFRRKLYRVTRILCVDHTGVGFLLVPM